ncbi:MAG: hypothetical protein IKV14_07755 [Muribaculaceae bacterium]|nr:hypothetical protein [Muribaculaceae bacterium]
MNKELEAILADFETFVGHCVTENPNSQKSYVSYIKSLDKANDGETYQWLKEAVASETPIKHLSETFDKYFNNHPEKAPQNQWKSGVKHLGDFICGFTDSTINLHSIKDFDTIACKLVAQSAIFCSTEVFEMVKKGELGGKENLGIGNEFGAWFHYTFQRAKHFEKRGEYKDEKVRFDDNTQANSAIKAAILKGLSKYGIHGNSRQSFKGFEACHIWPDTCYDARYHTSVANIVLLPREIAGLTDHCQAVEDLLKYEAWKRFKFKPEEEEIPQRPKDYSKIKWRQ